MPGDHYTVLGLPRNATSKQVRMRFLELARSKHPDLFSGADKAEAEVDFQRITQAFNVLSDPVRRRELDNQLMNRGPGEKREAGDALKVYLNRGIRAYRDKKMLEAAENFDRATREDPESARAWYYLARACRHQKRWLSRARSAIAKACELEPMNATYLRLAGWVFAESGMSGRAERYLQQALDWGGEDAQVRRELERLRSGEGGLFKGAGG